MNLLNLAHQSIGNRLSTVAQNAGYEQDKNTGIIETNIWGNPEKPSSIAALSEFGIHNHDTKFY